MNAAFFREFCEKLPMPAEYVPTLSAYAERFAAEADWDALIRRFMAHDYKDIVDVLKEAAAIGARFDCHAYTSHWLFFAFCSVPLRVMYKERGVSEDIYWDSMRDLLWKFRECLDVKGVLGSFVASWFPGFFHMTRFALGRLQFEHAPFSGEYSRAGVTLHDGDDALNCHIPSCGPLTAEARMDSYRRAWKFYHKEFKNDIIPVRCSSWLLYPGHFDILPAKSNIVSFMRDFDIIRSGTDRDFSNAWRVFGASSINPPETWPRDTSLRRALADHYTAGGEVGSGYGILLFDGEKIL